MTTTDSVPVAHIQRLLDDVAKRIGYCKPSYEVSDGSKVGDNYLGVLFRVVVSEQDEERTGTPRAPVSLIFKAMPASVKRREALRVVNFFVNETNVYRTLLPAFAKFYADKGLLDEGAPFPSVPRCYEATTGGPEGEDTLVLEDMRPLGFTMHDRRVGLDHHHCRLVLQALAKIHATSFAMEALEPERFAKLRHMQTECLFDSGNPFADEIQSLAAKSLDYIAERFPESSEGYKKAHGMVSRYFDAMRELVQPHPDGGNAFTHGDCWTNNLLFKYTESGTVQEVCLLDFQLSRYAPPVLDVLYLLYTCTVRSMRDAHMDQLLRDYHARLCDILRELGCDPDRLYPWTTLQAQLRSHGGYGFGMSVMTIPLFLADSDEIPDIDAAFENDSKMSDVFRVETRSAVERDCRISDVLEEITRRGWM